MILLQKYIELQCEHNLVVHISIQLPISYKEMNNDVFIYDKNQTLKHVKTP